MATTTTWQHIAATVDTPSYYVWPTPIEKSGRDDREYRLIKLENGLQALLVHDAKTDKSAAALDVAVGHLSDPHDMPGLAHFCEHLLFMGTEQFPRENDYSEYITSNGGATNAYTATSNTNYYFRVSSSALLGALPRFAGFFHSPLFEPSCTARELLAVDSEHKKNLQADGWRLFQLNKSLSKPGHVWSKFGSGNKATLTEVGRQMKRAGLITNGVNGRSQNGSLTPSPFPSPIPSRIPSPVPSEASFESEADGGSVGRETRRRLVEWWEKHYCAGRMKLVILGKESLDILTENAVKLFSPILNRGLEPEILFKDSPWGPDQMGTIVFAKTVMDFRALEIMFPMPYQAPNYAVKPTSYLGHFLGHEGPGSIHSYLKNKGWVAQLSAGPSSGGRGFEFFKITVVLTKEGLENYKEVLNTIHAYFALLRASPLESFHQEEIKTLADIRFRFEEKRAPDSYASSVAEQMARPYPRDRILTGPRLVWEWDEPLVRSLLEGMTVDRCRVTLMAKDYTGIDVNGEWVKEKWYGTEHVVRRLDGELLEQGRNPRPVPELFLPGPNDFLPADLSVLKIPVDQPAKRPLKIRETPLSQLWYKKDDQFWVPKANVLLDISTPLANVSPRNALKTRYIADLVTDSLTEYSYDADLAGLRYSCSATLQGVIVSLGGYNDKLPILLQKVLEKLRNLQVKPERFALIKEQIRQEFQNFFMSQPYTLSDWQAQYFTASTLWTHQEKLDEIEYVTAEDVQAFVSELLSRVHINTLVQGNMDEQHAREIVVLAEKVLGSRALTPSEITADRSLLLPKGKNFVYQATVQNKDDVNSSLTYYCEIGPLVDVPLRAILGIFAQIIHEPCFNVLRTKEQLGYIVSSSVWMNSASLGFRIMVQSERPPDYLETRVDAFLEHFRDVLENMSDEEFNQQRDAFIDKKLEKLKNLNEEAQRFWAHINSRYNDFTRRETDALYLRHVTRQHVLDFFLKYIHPDSPSRSKLSIHMRSQISPDAKFSVTASKAFLSSLGQHGIQVQEDQDDAEPSIRSVKAHWSEQFELLPDLKPEAKEELLHMIDKLAELHPSDNTVQKEVRHKEGTIVIQDVASFKAGLALSRAAAPIEDFVDYTSAVEDFPAVTLAKL